MRILNIRTLAGPNIYTYAPALLMRLDLEDLTGKGSHEIPGLIDRLLARLPGLQTHRCSPGRPGGFLEQLREGTHLAHVVEHVALELTECAGVPVFYGKTREADGPGLYNVIIKYRAEKGTRRLLNIAVELVESLTKGETFPLEERLDEVRRIISQTELGPSTRAIVDAARSRGIPCARICDGSVVRLGYGKHRKFIQATTSSSTSSVAVEIAGDKALTKAILDQASIPVARGETVRTEEEAIAALEYINGPVVVKPLDGHQGKGVSLNLTTPDEVRRAFQIAREYSSAVLVEEVLTGQDYRVLVVNGKMVAASVRRPCSVVGDGSRTIRQLIEAENQNPLRGDGHEKPLTKIIVDPELHCSLQKQALSFDSRPKAGEVVYLRQCANLSKGGTATDVTDAVHPEVARMCERVARIVGLDICGIDLILEDISEPLRKGRGGIIEVNASPGLRMHLHPNEGMRRDVGAAIVDMLYPAGSAARVPVISITGTNGKTTVTRMIGHVVSESGATVGMTTTDGIYIGGQMIVEGDMTGPHSATTVLSDPAVEVAVLETARGGITRRGLGYDWSDVAVITNIRPDHIGQDGIRSVKDLVHIKSLVAERVREGGTLILNADDEQLARLMEIPRVRRVKKNVVYFSLAENHILIERHLNAGGTAYYLKGGWIVEATGHRSWRIVNLSTIPVTMGGTAGFQIANAMAAIAACRAYGISREQAACSIASFRTEQHNPGRMNLYRVGGGYVMIDYGHNPDAFEAIGQLISRWPGRKVTGIVGVPGDRVDGLIAQAGRAAAKYFHRVVIREDKDLRGRQPGEVMRLLRESVTDEAPGGECLTVFDECEALEHELRLLREGDIIVVFYDKRHDILGVLERHGATVANTIEEEMSQFSMTGA